MPLTLPAALRTHLDGELLTLASLWKITRTDGQVYRFTDHDKPITYAGERYEVGLGYNRSAIEDKSDLSVDNMDLTGVIDGQTIRRADVRGGLFDDAAISITVVDYTNPEGGGAVRRSGWIGGVTQDNLGQFHAELRGLSQALSEGMMDTYTPGCRVDLGGTKCKVPLVRDQSERVDGQTYVASQWITVPEVPDLVFRCTQGGRVEEASLFDHYTYDVDAGDTVIDNETTWLAVERFDRPFTVLAGGDRRDFTIAVEEPRTGLYGDWYDHGVVEFLTGANAGISKEVRVFTPNSQSDQGDVTLFLRMPFNVETGDTGIIYPGCPKTTDACQGRFGNILNFRGFPHVPGDNFVKDYPDKK